MMDPETQRIIEAVIERAEQACRYMLKHNQDGLEEGEYASGFEVACGACEGAIRQQVMRHIESDLAGRL
jgi:hypothetical protein